MRGVSSRNEKTVASTGQSNRLRSLQRRVLHCQRFFHTKRENGIEHNVANPRTLCVLRPPSTPHLAYSLLQFGLHVALPRIALSHVGRQNELTFVGAIPQARLKSVTFVFTTS